MDHPLLAWDHVTYCLDC